MARTRSEARRRRIVSVAAQLFAELGYEQVSMALIADRVGGSKATLYGYFPSKDELVRAVMQQEVLTEADRIIGGFPSDPDDLRSSLIDLGIAFNVKRSSAMPITNMRIAATQRHGSRLGTDFYEAALRPSFQRLADKFEALMDEGKLRRAAPFIAAMHWKGLCDWDFFERRLLGVIDGPQMREIEAVAALAADAFLRLYGAPSVPPGARAGAGLEQHGRPSLRL
jgi:AcrR family transcriptional regulator